MEEIRGKLVKLLDWLEQDEGERRAKIDAVLAECRALLRGDEGTGPKVTRLKKYWSDVWAERYRSPYSFSNHAMVGASLKRWLQAHSEQEVQARMLAFVRDEDRFYVSRRHPFELFVKAFNSCVGLPAPQSEVGAEASAQRARAARGE